MSETDDTDTLLLIPPDFYVIDSSDSESKNYGECFNVVNTLIDHVTRLEDRVNHLAKISDTSKYSASLDSHLNSFQMSNPPEFNYPTSSQSTPQKPRGKHASISLPTTPSTDRFSPRKARQMYPRKSRTDMNRSTSSNSTSPDKPNKEKLLQEVDKFITNVKTLQKLSVPKNLNNEFSKSAKSNEMDMHDVDRMLQEMEIQQHDIELKLRQKEGEMMRNKWSDLEPKCLQTNTWKPGENKNTVPDLHTGMRDIMYGSTRSTSPVPIEEPCVKKTVAGKSEAGRPLHRESIPKHSDLVDTSFSSNNSTQITSYQNQPPNVFSSNPGSQFDSNRIVSPESLRIHSNAVQVLHMHQNSLQKAEEDRKKHLSDEAHSEKLAGEYGLMNLADLWGQKNSLKNSSDLSRGDTSKIIYKLEEERVRRQHCEQLITELQTRVLEQQQKLAVAIEVDNSKDEVIAKFRDAWEKISVRMQTLHNENKNLEQRCNVIQNRCSTDLVEANNKVTHFEREASKALDLTHKNQEKFSKLDQEKVVLVRQIEDLQKIVHEIRHKMSAETEKNQQLAEVLAEKEIEANKNKQVMSDAQKEVQHSKRAVDMCQAELTSMKTEYNHLLIQLNDQKVSAKNSELEKHEIMTQLSDSRRTQQALKEDNDRLKIQLETTKVELRNFYQEQVETVVKEKLQEFQHQLHVAEQNLHEEMRKREHSIAHSAAQHMCQLSQQNKMEIKLLEEKHSEEIKLYELKLSQAHQNIETLVAKFKSQQEKRNHVAQQLQKVMEAQWYEAMKIINSNGKSPVVTQDTSSALEQLNSLKSTSFSNIQEMLSGGGNDPEGIGGEGAASSYKGNALVSQHSSSTMIEEDNYQSKKTLNYRVTAAEDTPISSRAPPVRNQRQTGTDSELQKYVQLLLNKVPGQVVDGDASQGRHHGKSEKTRGEQQRQEAPTSDRYPPTWQNPPCNEEEDRQRQNLFEDGPNRGCKGTTVREQRPGKPPWK